MQCSEESIALLKGQKRINFVTKKDYANFILRFEYDLPEGGDCGIGLRMTDINGDAAYEAMGEVQLLDDGSEKWFDRTNNVAKIEDWRYCASLFGIAAAKRDNINRQVWRKEKNFAGNGSYARVPAFGIIARSRSSVRKWKSS